MRRFNPYSSVLARHNFFDDKAMIRCVAMCAVFFGARRPCGFYASDTSIGQLAQLCKNLQGSSLDDSVWASSFASAFMAQHQAYPEIIADSREYRFVQWQ
jgi:hypothetical protein